LTGQAHLKPPKARGFWIIIQSKQFRRITVKQTLRNQMLAALATLNQCMQNCPADEWQKSHNDAPFSQVLFHTLFYTDFYLSPNEHEFKLQLFHRQNKAIFRDYEEFEYKKSEQIYTREEILVYLKFCHDKINKYFDEIKDSNLSEKYSAKNMTFMELSIYNTRHIQHHAAQLGLRIQQVTGKELKWISSGWIE
jgi:hypothetical protein